MSNLISSRDGYFFEIRNGALEYLGPSPDLSANQQVEQIYQLYSAFLSAFPLQGIQSAERDDVLATAFAEKLSGEVVLYANSEPAQPHHEHAA